VKKLFPLLALLLGVAVSLPAHAAASKYSTTPSTPSATTTPNATPDYIAASFGDYDFDKGGNRNAIDYRLEYQWGASLIPMMNHDWASSENWVLLHPVVGFEGDDSGMTYFNGGLNLDVPLGSKVVLTWGEVLGWYGHGNEKQALGSPLEFRSQLELGWKFDNNMRLSGYISHMSNAGIGDHDPGGETLGAYLRVPVSWLAH
jgi:lipid A 3-O-deacylase